MRFVWIGIVVLTGTAFAQDADPAFSSPPSKTLERAIKLYDKADFYSATVELQKVLDKETGDDDKNIQRAEFFMMKSLYQMKLYAASLERLDRLVAKGSAHTYFTAAAKWNAALSRVLPDFVVRDPLFAYRGTQFLNDPVLASVHDELALVYGRCLAAHDVPKQEVLAAFAAIPPTSEFASRAQLEIARVKFRGHDVDGGITAAIAGATKADQTLDAGRTIASWTHQLDAADRARAPLAELAKRDDYARYQHSRAMLDGRDEVRGLGKISSETLDAVVFASACTGGWPDDIKPRARDTIAQARETIDRLLAVEDNAELYDRIGRVRKSAGTRGEQAVVMILDDAAIRERFTWNAELATELDLVQRADKAWQTTQVAAEILQTLVVLQSVAQAETGKLARGELERFKRELDPLAGVLDHANPGFAISAGPDVEPGRGFRIPRALCGGGSGGTGLIASPTQPQARGCGGCTAGDPSLGVLLLLLFRRRARRR